MSPTALVQLLVSGGSLSDVDADALEATAEMARRLAARLLDDLGEVLVIEGRPLIDVLRGPLVMRRAARRRPTFTVFNGGVAS